MNNLLDLNPEQLRERTSSVDEHFIHCQWNSQRTLAAFIPSEALTFLDLGCGPIADITDLLPDMDYTGIDFVAEYLADLQRGRSTVRPFHFSRKRFVAASMEALPLPGAYYDIVYSRHTLEHVPNLGRALLELQRVLKPGGRFIFCVPAAPAIDIEPAHVTRWRVYRWLSAIGSIVSIRSFGWHDYFTCEVYGYGVKPGDPASPLFDRVHQGLRRVYNFRQFYLRWLFHRAP